MKCLKHFENVQHFFFTNEQLFRIHYNLTENFIVQLNTSSKKHKKHTTSI